MAIPQRPTRPVDEDLSGYEMEEDLSGYELEDDKEDTSGYEKDSTFWSRTKPALEGLGHFAKNVFIAGAFPHGNTPEQIRARQEIGQGVVEPFTELGNLERMKPKHDNIIQNANDVVQGLGENVARFTTGMAGMNYDELDEDIQGFQKDPSLRGAGAILGDVAVPVGVAALTKYGVKGVKAGVKKYGGKLPTVEPPPVIRGVAGIDPAVPVPIPEVRRLGMGERTPPVTRADRLVGEGTRGPDFVASPEGTVTRGTEPRPDLSSTPGATVPEFSSRPSGAVELPERTQTNWDWAADDARRGTATVDRPARGDVRGGFPENQGASTFLDNEIAEGRVTRRQADVILDWIGRFDDVTEIPQEFVPNEATQTPRQLARNKKLMRLFMDAKGAMSPGEAALGYPHNVVPRSLMPREVQTGLLNQAPERVVSGPPDVSKFGALSLEEMNQLPGKVVTIPGDVPTPKGRARKPVPPPVEKKATLGKGAGKVEIEPVETYDKMHGPENPAVTRARRIEKVRSQPDSPARSSILAKLEVEEGRRATAEANRARPTDPRNVHRTHEVTGEAAANLRREAAARVDGAVDAMPPSSIRDGLIDQSGHIAKELGTLGAIKADIFASGSRQLKKMGPVGQHIAKLLGDFDTEASASGGRFSSKLHDVSSGLDKTDKATVARLVAGQDVPNATPAARSAYAEIKNIMNELGATTSASADAPMLPGMEAPFDKFTAQMFPEKVKQRFVDKYLDIKDKTKQYNAMIKAGIDPNEALIHVEGLAKHGSEWVNTPEGKNLLKGIEHNMSFEVLESHLYEAAREAEMNKRFGEKAFEKGSKLPKLLEQLSPNERKRATDIIDSYFGRGPAAHRWSTKAAGTISRIEVAAKLTSFALKNIGDFASVVRDGGGARTLREIGKALTDSKAKKGATQSGAFEIFYHNLLDDPTFGTKIGKWYGMEKIETFIRTVGSNVGRSIVEHNFEKLKKNPTDAVLRKELSTFLEHPIDSYLEKGSLTSKDLDFASGRFVESTSGKPNAMTLPPAFFARNPLARLPLLFKRFAFTQSKNMMDSFAKSHIPVGEGRITKRIPTARSARALTAKGARIVGASLFLGELVGDTLAGIKASLDPDEDIMEAIANRGDLQERLWANAMQSWLFGLVGDAYKATAGGPISALKFVAGAPISDAADILTGLYKAADSETDTGQKRSWETRLGPLRNVVARNVPVPIIGPAIGALIDTPEKKKPNKFAPKPFRPPVGGFAPSR